MKRIQLTLIIAFGLLIIHPSWASRAYVTDSFKITLRRGPSNEHLIVAMIPSGAPVEILESSSDWTHVRLLDDERGQKEGWVLSRFLMTREPWESKAETLSKEVDSLKKEIAQLTEQFSESSGNRENLAGKLQEKEKTLKQLQEEYSTLKRGASGYLNLKKDYEATLSALETAKVTNQRLTEENEDLRATQKIKWFLIGALVLFSGWLIGVFTGRLQKKLRRTSYYEL
jgi:SH3 domain protein